VARECGQPDINVARGDENESSEGSSAERERGSTVSVWLYPTDQA